MSFSDFFPPIFIILTLWVMRTRFTSRIDTSWPIVYYLFLVIFVRSNEGEFNNYWIFAGVVFALFMRYEFMAGAILKMFRAGEFVVHMYIVVICFQMFSKAIA